MLPLFTVHKLSFLHSTLKGSALKPFLNATTRSLPFSCRSFQVSFGGQVKLQDQAVLLCYLYHYKDVL